MCIGSVLTLLRSRAYTLEHTHTQAHTHAHTNTNVHAHTPHTHSDSYLYPEFIAVDALAVAVRGDCYQRSALWQLSIVNTRQYVNVHRLVPFSELHGFHAAAAHAHPHHGQTQTKER